MEHSCFPNSFLNRLEVIGSSDITPEDSEKYWVEHKAGMTWGIQKALEESDYPRDVAILGAGKCNDIRLVELMQRGSVQNVDLYDLDADGLKFAINNVKARINKIMPEAIDFANFNPVLADVTFVLRNLLKKFDQVRSSFLSGIAPRGPKRQKMLYWSIMGAIYESLEMREIPEKQYNLVVSDCILSQILMGLQIQIEDLRHDLLNSAEVNFDLWEEMEEVVQEVFIEDHIKVLKKMTRPGGAIFIASDKILLFRGKVHRNHAGMLKSMQERGELPENEVIRDFGGDYVVEELEIPRYKYMDGDLLQILQNHKTSLSVLDSKEWEWNRSPHELQKEDSTFGAERVQGVVLKRK